MYQQLLHIAGIGILSAVLAVGTIIGNAMRIDKDPAVDGPRALLAEFFGLWIAFACLAWSFLVAGPAQLQWILRGLAAISAIVAFALAAWFAGTPEVRIRLDQEPTGFGTPITALDLQKYHEQNEQPSFTDDSVRRDHTWSELNPEAK
jgi:hypothetical protein